MVRCPPIAGFSDPARSAGRDVARLRVGAILLALTGGATATWEWACDRPCGNELALFAIGLAQLALFATRPTRAVAIRAAFVSSIAVVSLLAARADSTGTDDVALAARAISSVLLGTAVLAPFGAAGHATLGAVGTGVVGATLVGHEAPFPVAGRILLEIVFGASIAVLVARFVQRASSPTIPESDGRGPERHGRADDPEGVAHLGHDLRHSLAVALGYSEMAGDADLVDTERERALGGVRRSLRELDDMIGHLLEGAADEVGRLRLASEPIDIAALFAELGDALRVLLRGRPVLVAVDDGGIGTVRGDRRRLGRVLGNLLDNAAKHTERGEIALRARRTGDLVVFEVRDSGPGIAPEDLPRIFEPWRQAANAGQGGFGLGLAISRRLAERMGGTLEAASGPGGSSFLLRLPASPPSGTHPA